MNTLSPIFTDITIWAGKEIKFEIYKTNNFDGLGFIAQAYGLILNKDNELLLIAHNNNIWSLPGGHIEKGETTLQGLIRELYEETAAIVEEDKCIPFFIQRSFIKKNELWVQDELQARYLIRDYKFEEFIRDPDESNPVVKQKFFKLDSLKDNLKWGKTTDFILSELKKSI